MNYQIGDIIRSIHSGCYFMIVEARGDCYKIQYLENPEIKPFYGKRYINDNTKLIQKGSTS